MMYLSQRLSFWMLLSLILVINQACKSENTSLSNESLTPDKFSKLPIYSLLQKNDALSRESLAKALEEDYKNFLNLNTLTVGQKAFREILFASINSLRYGADSLCKEEEKIQLFHGRKDTNNKTLADKKFLISAYIESARENASLRLGTEFFSSPKNWNNYDDEKKPLNNTIDAQDFEALASHHTHEYALSPFVSMTLMSKAALGWGDKIFQIKMCPQRGFSTSDQRFVTEREFMVFGFILPEEIVDVTTGEIAAQTKPSNISSCYSPQLKGTGRDYSRQLTENTLTQYNRLAVDYAEKIRLKQNTTGWNSVLNQYISTQCGCLRMHRQSNTLMLSDKAYYEKQAALGNPLRAWPVDSSCDMETTQVPKTAFILNSETNLKSDPNKQAKDLMATEKCLLKRGDAIVLENSETIGSHFKLSFKEPLPNGCLLKSPAYLFTDHGEIVQ